MGPPGGPCGRKIGLGDSKMRNAKKGNPRATRDPKDVIEGLGGTALRVYLVLVKVGRPVGVRELQRMMGFKSPSTAKHHLDRLADMGLVIKDKEGNYQAVYEGELLPLIYTRLMGRLVPTLAPLGLFGIVVVVTELMLFGLRSPSLTLALTGLSLALIYLSIKTRRWIERMTKTGTS